MSKIKIDRDQLIADLSAMIRSASVNTFGAPSGIGAEAAMAELFEAKLRSLGLAPRYPLRK